MRALSIGVLGCGITRRGRPLLRALPIFLADSHISFSFSCISNVTLWWIVFTALCSSSVSMYRSIGGVPLSLSIAATGALLYAPMIFLRHLFCTVASGLY